MMPSDGLRGMRTARWLIRAPAADADPRQLLDFAAVWAVNCCDRDRRGLDADIVEAIADAYARLYGAEPRRA